MPSWSELTGRLLAGALGVALLVTGCSDDDGGDGYVTLSEVDPG